MRAVLIMLISLVTLGAGVGIRYYVEREVGTHTVVIETAPAPAPPMTQLPGVATTTTSNASVAYKEITEWIATLPPSSREDIQAARNLLLTKYQTQRTRSEYSTFDGCVNFIISSAVTPLAAGPIADLTRRTLAFETLVSNQASSTTVTTIKKELVTSLVERHLMTDVIGELGSNVVAGTDAVRSTIISKASCANLPVPKKYK